MLWKVSRLERKQHIGRIISPASDCDDRNSKLTSADFPCRINMVTSLLYLTWLVCGDDSTPAIDTSPRPFSGSKNTAFIFISKCLHFSQCCVNLIKAASVYLSTDSLLITWGAHEEKSKVSPLLPRFLPQPHIVLRNLACDIVDVIQMLGIHHMFLFNSQRKHS